MYRYVCVCVLDAPRDIVSSGNMGGSVCMYGGTCHIHTILCPGRGGGGGWWGIRTLTASQSGVVCERMCMCVRE